MELLQELFFTASLALVLTFLVAKLLALVTAGESELKSRNVGGETVLEKLQFGERLRVQGFESEKKVECVEEAVENIDEFVGEDSGTVDEVVETVLLEEKVEEERCGVSEILLDGGCREEVERIGLPENLSDEKSTEEETVVRNSDDFELEGVKQANIDDSTNEKRENGKGEVIDVKSTSEDIGFAQSEEIGALENESKEEGKEQLFFGDDDDWEGIERSELENVFADASKFVGSMDEDHLANVVSDLQMQLYGLSKIATEGTCREPQPMALRVSARAKWNSWQRLGNMSPEVAMEQYISLLSDRVPGWTEGYYAGDSKRESIEAGIPPAPAPIMSTFLDHQPNLAPEREPELKSRAAKGDFTGDVYLEDMVGE